MSIGRTPKGADIAGWVLKGDPKVYDLDADLEARGVIRNWSIYGNYRADLMAEGQRCILWRSGPHGAIVAAGYVTGPAYRDHADPSEWVDQSKAKAAELFVPVELYQLDEPIPRPELKAHPVLSHAEFLKAPMMSNPTILTPEELDALEELLVGIEPHPLPFFAIIVTRTSKFGVDESESGAGFTLFEEADNGEFVAISEHESALDGVLAAAAAASTEIEAQPIVDWDDGGTLIGRVRTDEGGAVGIYKVEGGYEAIEVEDDDDLYLIGEDTRLSVLLQSLFENFGSSPADSGSD
jgi:hypothetical protein